MKRTTVTFVKALKKYVLEVKFEDGTRGNFDVSHLSGKGIFKQWDEGNGFFEVFIDEESGAVAWPNGLDIDTIAIYCALKNISVDEFITSKYRYAPN